MNSLPLFRRAVLAAIAAFATFPIAGIFEAVSQEEKPAPAPSPEEFQKIMADYQEFIQPGEEHEAFRTFVGEWTVDSKMWMDPESPPLESKAEVTFEVIMGGRYLVQHYRSESKEFGKYTGRGIIAYDKVAKEFVSTWMDSMGTGIMISRGKVNEDGAMDMISEPIYDPLTNKKVKYRLVNKAVDKDRLSFKMFSLEGEGKKEHLVMDLDYARKK